jgi:hypothetical protein
MARNFTQKDISTLIGNTLDHYDSAIYGFLGPVLGPVFFPNYDPIVQLILVYSILGTSLFTRPIGSFIFGMIARKHGPLFGMSYSLIGIAIASVLIGFLPSYASIGWMAPLSLIFIRMIKGIFAAGESTIAKLYIMENKAAPLALKASYTYQTSTVVGNIIASLAVMLVLTSQDENAWRVCFWAGGLTGLIGCFLRKYSTSIEEKKAFHSFRVPQLKSLWPHKANILRVAMATGFGHITGAVPFVFMNSFIPLITNISLETMMALNTALLCLDMVLIPLIGRLILPHDGVKVMVISSLVLALTIIPLFSFLPNASLGYVVFVRMWIIFWGVVFMCPMNFWFKQLFPASDQYLLVGMGGALGATTIGRLTTPLCLWLWYVTGLSFMPAIYLFVIIIVTAYVIFTVKPKMFHVKQFATQTS